MIVCFSVSLDREQEDAYAVEVMAVDKGQPPLTGHTTLYVSVSDTNDQAPYFDPPVPQGLVTEGEIPNTLVLDLSSHTYDPDLPPHQVELSL